MAWLVLRRYNGRHVECTKPSCAIVRNEGGGWKDLRFNRIAPRLSLIRPAGTGRARAFTIRTNLSGGLLIAAPRRKRSAERSGLLIRNSRDCCSLVSVNRSFWRPCLTLRISGWGLRPLYSLHKLKTGFREDHENPVISFLAPRPGLEPGTCGLTVRRSTD